MIVAGLAQLGLAWWVARRPGAPAAIVGIVGSLVIVTLYLLDHTRGLPIGPSPVDLAEGHAVALGFTRAERTGPAAVAATVAELVTICGLVTLLPLTLRRRVVNLLGALGLGAWIAWLLGGLG